MYEQVKKPKENEGRAVANSVAHKKSNVKQGFGFIHNRCTVGNSNTVEHPTPLASFTPHCSSNLQLKQQANIIGSKCSLFFPKQLKDIGEVTMDNTATSDGQEIYLNMKRNGKTKKMTMSCKHAMGTFVGACDKNFSSGGDTNIIINKSLPDCIALFEVFCAAVATNWDKDKCDWPPETSVDNEGVTLINPGGGGHVYPKGGDSTVRIGAGDDWKCFMTIAKGVYTPHLKPNITQFYKNYEDTLEGTIFKGKMDTGKAQYHIV